MPPLYTPTVLSPRPDKLLQRLRKAGTIPDITARQWLDYVRKTSLDFGSREVLEMWGDGEQSEQDTLAAVQSSLDGAMEVFGDVFPHRPAIAFRGLPLGHVGKFIKPDGSVDPYREVFDPAFDFQAWLKQPYDANKGGVGLSWTWDEAAAINEGQGRGPTNTVLKAEVPAQAVDWLYSFSVWVNDPDEREIRLTAGSKVHLLGVRRFDCDKQAYEGDWIDTGRRTVLSSAPKPAATRPAP